MLWIFARGSTTHAPGHARANAQECPVDAHKHGTPCTRERPGAPPRRHCSCRRLGAAAGVVLAALVVLTTLPRRLVAGMIMRR